MGFWQNQAENPFTAANAKNIEPRCRDQRQRKFSNR